MSNNRRTLEERLAEKQRLLDAEREKMRAYEAQVKALNAKKRDEDRKERTHRLIEVGATVESVLGAPITKDMLPGLMNWLASQEQRGRYFSKALGISADGEGRTLDYGVDSIAEVFPISEVEEIVTNEL